MSEYRAEYDPGPGGWDNGPDADDGELAARVAQIRADCDRRVAHEDWQYRDRPPPVKRPLTGAEALRRLSEQDATAPTPVMRRIAAEAEARSYMESEGQRCLDWLGAHATGNVGP